MGVKQLNDIRSFGVLAVWEPILRTQPRARSGRRSIPAYVVSQDRNSYRYLILILCRTPPCNRFCEIIALLTSSASRFLSTNRDPLVARELRNLWKGENPLTGDHLLLSS